MQKIVLVLLVITLTSQIFSKDETVKLEYLKPDIRAVQFGVTDFFRFTSFTGSTISYKKHSTKNKAIRYSLSLTNSFYNEMGDEIEEHFSYDSLYSQYKSEIKDRNSNSYFGLSIEIIRYVKSITDLYPYIGIGGSLYYNAQTINTINSYNNLYKLNSDSYSVGFVGVAGVEWFVKNSISLHCEYYSTMRFGRTFKKQITEDRYYTSSHEKVTIKTEEPFHNVGSYVKFGISLYF